MVSFVRHARWRQGPAGGEVVKGRGPRSVLATRVGFCPRQGARHTVQLQACSVDFDLADRDGLTDRGGGF